MWMRSGCSRFLGLVVAMACGALAATRAEAGFTSVKPPSPGQSASSSYSAGADFTPRCEVPELKHDSSRAVSSVDLPDAADLRHGKPGAEDPLVKQLTGDKSGDKATYSLFWDDPTRAKTGDTFNDFRVDVKSAAPVVVPLPPGVWAGLVSLVVVIAFQVRRHRRLLA